MSIQHFPCTPMPLAADIAQLRQCADNDPRHRRHDALVAQHVGVGLVFLHMLGPDDARGYLSRSGVPRHVVERIVTGGRCRGDTGRAGSSRS